MKRLAWFAVVVLATLTGVVLLWQFRDVSVLFVFSLVVAGAARKPIEYLTSRGLPRGLAMALTYLGSVLVIGGLLALAASRIVGELQTSSDAFANAYQNFKAHPGGGVAGLLAERLPPLEAFYRTITSAEGTSLIFTALGTTVSFFDSVSKVLVVLVLSIYWGSDQVRFERLWLSLLPAEQRSQARNIWRTIESGVGAYLRSEIVQGLLAGLVLWLGFSLLGLPAPVLLAVMGALAWFIPLLGGAVACALAVMVGAFHGPLAAVAAGIFTLAVFFVLEMVVERRLFDRRRYSAILTVLVMVALADALGVFGLLVAPPLAAAIQIFFREVTAQRVTAAPTRQQAAPKLAQTRERLAHAREALAKVEEPAPELANLLQRLETLVDTVTDEVDDEPPSMPDGFARLVAVEQTQV